LATVLGIFVNTRYWLASHGNCDEWMNEWMNEWINDWVNDMCVCSWWCRCRRSRTWPTFKQAIREWLRARERDPRTLDDSCSWSSVAAAVVAGAVVAAAVVCRSSGSSASGLPEQWLPEQW
jgi:hypothetical protein